MTEFAYTAHDAAGQPLDGTLRAATLDAAQTRLQQLGLTIDHIEAVVPSVGTRPLGASDVIAFNEQFTQLATAGLPVEYGLKLIAEDLKHGRLADAMRALAGELEGGASLSEAFARHANQFPPLYGKLVDAGVRSGNLAGLLLNLGRHLETIGRLRAALWRALTYPIMVLIFLAIVLVIIDRFILPQYLSMFADFAKLHEKQVYDWRNSHYTIVPPPTVPWPTQVLMSMGGILPIAVVVIVLAIFIGPLLLQRFGRRNSDIERFATRMPLIGPILRQSLLARWCDATALATATGMDLPAATRLASEALQSPGLMLDGMNLAEHAEAGRPLDSGERYVILPRTIPAAMELASRTSSVPATMRSLAELYEKQVDLRLENLPALISPFLLIFLAVLIGFVIIALTLPMVEYVRYTSGGIGGF